ncbi:uncharacterized protein MEPE_06080 [Melanopsichium pennsylvanicum]|uniref:SWI/SNF and RSC complexes subunit Ssr4 C-terminal domain-containing protein n=2 Tax=Melanopsichium pennsylvanicum TaxID=63383 RepID=A0AAJ4XRV9_9BASI|nr:uncharacterized protein BN887_02639 [Melanopsichium pennsylvanicum 4]SNX87370.1 uncharacterized protein MEPE_06080 [Melanopsichium pennsylvanicum]
MNMPPPPGPPQGVHPNHPSMSPSQAMRPHPSHPQFMPSQQQYHMDTPTPSSTRGRKRKLTAQHPHSHTHPSTHTHPPPQQQPNRRPSMLGAPHPSHPGQQLPQPFPSHRQPGPAFLGLNLPPTIADELPESIFDDLDRLTPRDIAVARYARNHQLMSTIFDARRIDTLVPAPSPYSNIKPQDVEEKIAKIQQESERLEKQHHLRLQELRQSSSANKAASAKDKSGDGEDAVEGETVASWAQGPSRGRILGVGFVRADSPEEFKPKVVKTTPPVFTAAGVVESNSGADVGDEFKPCSEEPATEAAKEKEEQEAARREAERIAVEKVNIELGVTQPASEVSAPSVPAPVIAPAATAATTSTPSAPIAGEAGTAPANAAAASTSDAAGVTNVASATAEIPPPAADAEEAPAAPVLAPDEISATEGTHANPDATAIAVPTAPVAAAEKVNTEDAAPDAALAVAIEETAAPKEQAAVSVAESAGTFSPSVETSATTAQAAQQVESATAVAGAQEDGDVAMVERVEPIRLQDEQVVPTISDQLEVSANQDIKLDEMVQ